MTDEVTTSNTTA